MRDSRRWWRSVAAKKKKTTDVEEGQRRPANKHGLLLSVITWNDDGWSSQDLLQTWRKWWQNPISQPGSSKPPMNSLLQQRSWRVAEEASSWSGVCCAGKHHPKADSKDLCLTVSACGWWHDRGVINSQQQHIVACSYHSYHRLIISTCRSDL